jgi:hypothetical protein
MQGFETEQLRKCKRKQGFAIGRQKRRSSIIDGRNVMMDHSGMIDTDFAAATGFVTTMF